MRLERAKGIEPSYAAWEAAVLPLNYARRISEFNRYFKKAVSGSCRQHLLDLLAAFFNKRLGRNVFDGGKSKAKTTRLLTRPQPFEQPHYIRLHIDRRNAPRSEALVARSPATMSALRQASASVATTHRGNLLRASTSASHLIVRTRLYTRSQRQLDRRRCS
jgi:hypothetical protein